jgi:hypothetical protein
MTESEIIDELKATLLQLTRKIKVSLHVQFFFDDDDETYSIELPFRLNVGDRFYMRDLLKSDDVAPGYFEVDACEFDRDENGDIHQYCRVKQSDDYFRV